MAKKIENRKRGYRVTFNKHLLSKEFIVCKKEGEKLDNVLKEDKRIKFFDFALEKGKVNNNYHWQGYAEFDRLVDLQAFRNKFDLSFVEKAKGSREENQKYVFKDGGLSFSFVRDKDTLKKRQRWTSDMHDFNKSIISLDQQIQQKKIKIFEDIKLIFPLLFLKNNNLCREIWNRHYEIKYVRKSAKTIWIYGPSRVGKTTLTGKYLLSIKAPESAVCKKKASDENSPKLWFHNSEQDATILWIEEVRANFPKYNDLIKLIDGDKFLEVKGGHIINRFELIIINSLWTPEEIFGHMEPEHQIEILSRIYRGNNSAVFSMPERNLIINKTHELPHNLQNRFLTNEVRNNSSNYSEHILKTLKEII